MDHMTQDEQTIVVVCSMTLDEQEMPATVTQAYEERFLFLLLLLRQPRARLVYVTSQAVNPSIVDYYLALLPGVIPSHARERLFLVSPLDGSPRPLSEKLLERPRLLARIRSLIPDPSARTSSPSTRPSASVISRSRSGSRCTAPIRASSTTGRRPAAGGCSPSRACPTRRAERA